MLRAIHDPQHAAALQKTARPGQVTRPCRLRLLPAEELFINRYIVVLTRGSPMVVCGSLWEVMAGMVLAMDLSRGGTGPQRMLFLGKHDYSMDERGRVPMPPRFREALMQGIILTQGTPDRCIRAYPQDAFEEQAALYMSFAGDDARRPRRRAAASSATPSRLSWTSRVAC